LGPYLSEAERKRLPSFKFVIENPQDEIDGNCLMPENLAYSGLGPDGPYVKICTNNITNIKIVVTASSIMGFFKQESLTYSQQDKYFELMSRQIYRNTRLLSSGRQAKAICGVTYYAYLISRHMDIETCLNTPISTTVDFTDWVNSAVVFDARTVHGMSNVILRNPTNDIEAVDDMVNIVTDSNLRNIVRFVIYHEIGHLAHGDLLSVASSSCDALKRELLADKFATDILVRSGRIESYADTEGPRGYWAGFTVSLQQGGPGANQHDRLAYERLRSAERAWAENARIISKAPYEASSYQKSVVSPDQLVRIKPDPKEMRSCKLGPPS
jgi:hypothetical protein